MQFNLGPFLTLSIHAKYQEDEERQPLLCAHLRSPNHTPRVLAIYPTSPRVLWGSFGFVLDALADAQDFIEQGRECVNKLGDILPEAQEKWQSLVRLADIGTKDLRDYL